MTLEIEERLMEKYPKFYGQLWGFECGDGWERILDVLGAKCEGEYVLRGENEEEVEISALQVKEKFGGLRVYTDFYSPKVNQAIKDAETEAWKTCEVCGEPGTHRLKDGWWGLRCEAHAGN